MALVSTGEGLFEEGQLQKKCYIAEDNPAAIIVAVEWYFGPKLVRRDVWVNAKTGFDVGAALGSIA